MKYKVLILLMCLLNVSCSTIKTHNVTFGHPYSGTEDAVKNFPCRVIYSTHTALVDFPFIVLDMPFSFVLDTILLPVDLFVKPKLDRELTVVNDRKCI
ncbi:YceK/YidQ family lipoprotein [Moritella sp. 5]|nr:YceK/YidQ family lipoprotein [Moritella sp. 5]